MGLKIGGHALRAEFPFIDRKVITRLKSHDVVVRHKQIHPALHTAIWTMRRHDLVDHASRLPAAPRLIMKMRAKLVDDPV